MWKKSARGERGQRARPTVDGNGHALVQNVAILALKGRDLAQLVELQVLGGGLGGVDLDDVELEVVGLRNGADRRAPGVVLRRCFRTEFDLGFRVMLAEALPHTCTACRKPLLRICRLYNYGWVVESKKEGLVAGSTFKNFCVHWIAGFQAVTALATGLKVEVVDWLKCQMWGQGRKRWAGNSENASHLWRADAPVNDPAHKARGNQRHSGHEEIAARRQWHLYDRPSR